MNSKIKQDIEQAIKLIKFNPFHSPNFSTYSSLYAFTNENIHHYFDKLQLKNKTILTAAGSGDHIFEAILKKAKQVESFDINKLTKYYISLKEAGFKALNYNEFIKYFFLENNIYDTFNETSYQKIRNYLQEEDLLFWDTLYTKYSGRKIRKSKLFFSTEESFLFLRNCVSYLEPKKYYELKDILNNPEYPFITSNFQNYSMTELPNQYNYSFDIINLSNIADFIDEIYSFAPIQNFKGFITEELATLLNDQGIICVAYMFWANRINQKKVPIINKSQVRELFFKDDFEEWLIDNSNMHNCTNDHLLVYQKRKR